MHSCSRSKPADRRFWPPWLSRARPMPSTRRAGRLQEVRRTAIPSRGPIAGLPVQCRPKSGSRSPPRRARVRPARGAYRAGSRGGRARTQCPGFLRSRVAAGGWWTSAPLRFVRACWPLGPRLIRRMEPFPEYEARNRLTGTIGAMPIGIRGRTTGRRWGERLWPRCPPAPTAARAVSDWADRPAGPASARNRQSESGLPGRSR